MRIVYALDHTPAPATPASEAALSGATVQSDRVLLKPDMLILVFVDQDRPFVSLNVCEKESNERDWGKVAHIWPGQVHIRALQQDICLVRCVSDVRRWRSACKAETWFDTPGANDVSLKTVLQGDPDESNNEQHNLGLMMLESAW